MKSVLIANTKGGCGKTTVATNLAGYLASIGNRVGISDLDRQKSSTHWVKRRPKDQYTIQSYTNLDKSSDLDWLIIDAPAGIRNDKLKDAVKLADCIIVPIQPSAFDSGATESFLEILSEEKAIRKEKTFVALVGMRVNTRTNAANILNTFMENTGFPILSNLRNAQVYVNAAEEGLSIFEMRPSLVKQDLEQWFPITQWVVSFNAK
jgi:chromosome partitioning protein